ncbi:hypothetical protein Krad_2508 [Kineococcus radiotolerans SRS30216 = ATCC BAA-149]|uniref:Uncharacterized protein n=1 Tax=Kineococcus radiotolerans (strain ATCC BAA-149 / DSM 14245 / SRS30216) TaxID=266940 RepID=A6WAZ4_KINRD|nr:hypothetical protein Krad_2508 [Kineococcus radiotolerans SRS30216 = ATCC BAA-149]
MHSSQQVAKARPRPRWLRAHSTTQRRRSADAAPMVDICLEEVGRDAMEPGANAWAALRRQPMPRDVSRLSRLDGSADSSCSSPRRRCEPRRSGWGHLPLAGERVPVLFKQGQP